ncbi:MAG: hypothetical protein J0H63_15195, partial [Rhizobiales bacterium]|nr:hypothetical protein [Hyphomicrobiales bacterium]
YLAGVIVHTCHFSLSYGLKQKKRPELVAPGLERGRSPADQGRIVVGDCGPGCDRRVRGNELIPGRPRPLVDPVERVKGGLVVGRGRPAILRGRDEGFDGNSEVHHLIFHPSTRV